MNYDDPEFENDDSELEDASYENSALYAIANAILPTRDEAISFRAGSGVETRWREDEKYLGGLDLDTIGSADVATNASNGGAYAGGKGTAVTRSQVIVNVIRSKAWTAYGRFCETAVPTSENNWGMKVTPNPELDEMEKSDKQAMQNGQPITDTTGKGVKVSDVAKDMRDLAEKRMEAMEREVDDQLTECKYNAEQRKGIWSAVYLGTMVMKGPMFIGDNHKKYVSKMVFDEEKGENVKVWTLQGRQGVKPASKAVRCWDVYPSPHCGQDVQRSPYMWEKSTLLPRELRDLATVDGYEETVITALLEEEPATHQGYKSLAEQKKPVKGMPYECWEYNGDVSTQLLEEAGINCAFLGPQKKVMACVMFVNDKPIKISINPIEGTGIPYDFWQWDILEDDSPWGIGLVRVLIWLQRIITGAFRSMMDNAGDSSGANYVMGDGITPIDGKMELTGKKGWRYTGTLEDVRKAFAQFQLTNNQQQLQAIIELAMRFVDIETGMPTLFQGEAQTAPETLGATNIMVDANNISTRQRISRYDDQITIPHISRYYHYNMQHSDKEEIKGGDMEVDAKGVRVLLEKDQARQSLLQIWALKNDPDIQKNTDWRKDVELLYKYLHLNILKSDGELQQDAEAAAQNPVAVSNPAMDVAKVRSEGEMNKEKLRQTSDMKELQFKAQQADLDRKHEKEMKTLEIQGKVMEYAERTKMEIPKIKAQLAMNAASYEKKAQSNAPGSTIPQVATPAIEPEGQAPAGEAFQK